MDKTAYCGQCGLAYRDQAPHLGLCPHCIKASQERLVKIPYEYELDGRIIKMYENQS